MYYLLNSVHGVIITLVELRRKHRNKVDSLIFLFYYQKMLLIFINDINIIDI